MNYVIVIDDGGELKTVTAQELDEIKDVCENSIGEELQKHLNNILDARAIADGTYNPEDND